jgi:hypothetical protein
MKHLHFNLSMRVYVPWNTQLDLQRSRIESLITSHSELITKQFLRNFIRVLVSRPDHRIAFSSTEDCTYVFILVYSYLQPQWSNGPKHNHHVDKPELYLLIWSPQVRNLYQSKNRVSYLWAMTGCTEKGFFCPPIEKHLLNIQKYPANRVAYNPVKYRVIKSKTLWEPGV